MTDNPKIENQGVTKQFVWAAVIATLAAVAGYLLGPVEVRYIEKLNDNTVLIGSVFAVGSVAGSFSDLYRKNF